MLDDETAACPHTVELVVIEIIGQLGFELYDRYRDPTEEQDRYPASESHIAPFKAELSSFRTQTVAWQQATTTRREKQGAAAVDDSELSEETRRMLEALGYLDDEK